MGKISRRDIFTRFTTKVSSVLGHAWVFVLALIVLLLWGLSGPLLGFSDTWQLIINTGTTIVTFLMVFIIQNTQNRDNLAMNLKLNAILKEFGVASEALFAAEAAEPASPRVLYAQRTSFEDQFCDVSAGIGARGGPEKLIKMATDQLDGRTA
jgi:low affinity Fe/Cu permease